MLSRIVFLRILFFVALVASAIVLTRNAGVWGRETIPFEVSASESAEGLYRGKPSKKALPCVAMVENGVALRGPYASISMLKEAPAGGYAYKDDYCYIKPQSSNKPMEIGAEKAKPFSWWISWAAYGGTFLLGVFFLSGGAPIAGPRPDGKFPHLDGLRGLACVVVVLFHYFGGIYAPFVKEILHEPETIAGWLRMPPLGILVSGMVAVEVFFVLSGFVLALPLLRQKGDIALKVRSALVRRPVRLLGVILFMMLFALIMSFIFPSAEPISLPVFAHDFFFSPFTESRNYVPPFWTLQIELYGSVGLFLLTWISHQKAWRWLLYVWIAILCHDTFYMGFLVGVVFADLFSMGLFHGRSRRNRLLAATSLILGIFLAALNLPELVGGDMKVGSNVLAGIASLDLWAATLVVAGVLNLAAAANFLSRPLPLFFGKISFSLYAVHMVFPFNEIAELHQWLHKLNWEPRFAGIFCFVLYWVLVLPAAWLINRFIDEPTIAFSKKLERRLFPISTANNAERESPVVEENLPPA